MFSVCTCCCNGGMIRKSVLATVSERKLGKEKSAEKKEERKILLGPENNILFR